MEEFVGFGNMILFMILIIVVLLKMLKCIRVICGEGGWYKLVIRYI